MVEAINAPAGNPGRGQHHLSKHAGQASQRLRERVASMVNAPSADRICLSSGSTASLNMAIFGLLWFCAKPEGERPLVVTSVLEHNAVRRPLNLLKQDRVCDVIEIGCDADGFIDATEVVEAATDPRCVAVVTNMCSNVIGTIQPTEAIGRGLRERAPRVLHMADAAQSMGALPIDVEAMAIDVLGFSGHKSMLGPVGTGGMYISERAYSVESGACEGGPIRPTIYGGTGGTLSGSIEDLNPPGLPGAFEVGTCNVVGRAGLLAALEDEAVPAHEVSLAHERRLVGMFIDRFADDDRVRILGPRGTERRHGVVSFTVVGHTANEVSAYLDGEHSIVVRAGLHCAPGAHGAMGTLEAGAVRVSPGPFSTDEEMARLLVAMEKLLES